MLADKYIVKVMKCLADRHRRKQRRKRVSESLEVMFGIYVASCVPRRSLQRPVDLAQLRHLVRIQGCGEHLLRLHQMEFVCRREHFRLRGLRHRHTAEIVAAERRGGIERDGSV